MGASKSSLSSGADANGHESSTLLDGSKASLPKSLNNVVTQGGKQRWVLGAHNLACAQEMIVMDGPATFVHRCLDSNLPYDHPRLNPGWITKYVLSFMFLIVAPAFMPFVYSRFLMRPSFGMHRIGESRIQWSREHHAFKIFSDRDDFGVDNLKMDMFKLKEALASSNDTEGNLFYLDNQTFQSNMSISLLQIALGGVTVLLFLIFSLVRVTFERTWLSQWWTFHVLHAVFFSPTFFRLKFTSSELFYGYVRLYKVLPCAWLAIEVSFMIVIPISILYFDKELELDERMRKLAEFIPLSIVAAYACGSLYLQAANSTFSMWLSTTMEYSVVSRQFMTEMGGIYDKLTTYTDVFALTTEEIEALASVRSVEMWLRYRCLEQYHNKKDHEIASHMNRGEWYQANKRLKGLIDDVGTKLEEYEKKYMDHCLIRKVYVVDTKSDISFLVDLVTESCLNTRADEGDVQ